MAKMSYAEKLKDPRWQKKRLEVLDAANFACEHCNAEDKTLHVHHRVYLYGKDPWEYDLGQLACLCEECHKIGGYSQQDLLTILSYLDEDSLNEVAGFAYRKLVDLHGGGDPTERDFTSVMGFAFVHGWGLAKCKLESDRVYDCISEVEKLAIKETDG